MHHRTATLKRTCIVIACIALFILLVAAWLGFFRSDDFFELQTAKFDTVNDPIKVFTKVDGDRHYRPTSKLFFWIHLLVFGLKPLGYFVTIILIFFLNLYLFYLLARHILGDLLGAYSAILLFLLQGNTYLYTVNWIAGINTVLSGVFIIATLFFYIKSADATHKAVLFYILSLVFFVLGLLSREITVIVIPTVLAYDVLLLRSGTPRKLAAVAKRLPVYMSFFILFVIYVLMRNSAGARSLLGEGGYIFSLNNLADGIVFFALQLGFLPAGVLLLAIPALLINKPPKWTLKLIAWGLFLALVATLPVLSLHWTSPTWLYIPAFGIAFAAAALFKQVLSINSKRATLLFYGVLVWAIIGNSLLFIKLSSSRWWQWGGYIRNVIEGVTTRYPDLPRGATLYFIDKTEQNSFCSMGGLFKGQHNVDAAFRVWYDAPSLQTRTVTDEASLIDAAIESGAGEAPPIFVFVYDEGSITDKTEWFQALRE
ncbi:MAG: hypothetical protein GTO29_04825 [Candidatus Latescibacteria bacterium]|nr:hypothetical protein [Candidatus Latescibacterota bacterium]NIO55410.1 hypothetical protein [Candidatus Latescibacterota bacterium]